MWILFGFLIAAIIFYILAMISIEYKWELAPIFIFWGSFSFIVCLIGFPINHFDTIENTYEKELKEGNPYEMVIQYELKDSVYISVDTIFVKIKK